MQFIPSTFVRFVIGSAFAATALAAIGVQAQTTTSNGLLRDKAGRTLYTFDQDVAGESRCYGGCATAWPPFLAAEGATAQQRLTLVIRKDGARQWAWDGKPLYAFAGDAQPGDASGDGSGGVWHVIKIDAAPPTAKKPSGYGGSN